MSIYAKVICDSVSPQGIRLTTMEVCLHRMVLAELNTHRVFSRNYRSSRAVPVAKLLEEVRTNPAMPVFWGANQAGMTATEELEDPELQHAKDHWLHAAEGAVAMAQEMAKAGLHKQIANRVLEPFMYTYGVITSTKWNNFFGLRLDKAAQPEMRALAVAMWEAWKGSTPNPLQPGEWHLPYINDEDWGTFTAHEVINWGDVAGFSNVPLGLIKQSVARCARVSYKPFDADRPSTLEEDLARYDKLVGAQPIHASPAEHQATPDEFDRPRNVVVPAELTEEQKWLRIMPVSIEAPWAHYELHGNFHGWVQYRKTIPGEAVAPLPGAGM